MSRNACVQIFRPNNGVNVDCYVNNSTQIEDFVRWYERLKNTSVDAVFIVGDDGVGKTTFVNHMVNVAVRKDTSILRNRFRNLSHLIDNVKSIKSAKIIQVAPPSQSEYRLLNVIHSFCRHTVFNGFTASINYLGAGINYTQNTTNHYLEIVDHINKIRRHDSGVPVLFVIEDAHKYTGVGESDALKSLVEYIYSRDIQNVGFVLLGNCAILDIFSEVIGLYDRIDMLPIQKSDLSAYIEAVFRVNNLEFRKEEFTGIVNAYNGCMLDTIKQLRSKNISFVSKNETIIRARLEGGIDI